MEERQTVMTKWTENEDLTQLCVASSISMTMVNNEHNKSVFITTMCKSLRMQFCTAGVKVWGLLFQGIGASTCCTICLLVKVWLRLSTIFCSSYSFSDLIVVISKTLCFSCCVVLMMKHHRNVIYFVMFSCFGHSELFPEPCHLTWSADWIWCMWSCRTQNLVFFHPAQWANMR